MPDNNLKLADAFAKDYDQSVVQNNWNGPQILFNEINDLIQPNSHILDLGIGTGASSILFKKSGHLITGLDGSAKMLEQCKKKNIADKLIKHNLKNTPFPFNNESFNAIISTGVFHLVHPLNPIIIEIKRLLSPKGFFSFTFQNTNEINEYKEIEPGIWENQTQSGVLNYKYSKSYISEILNQNGFEILKQKEFLAYKNQELQKDFYFNLIVAKLK